MAREHFKGARTVWRLKLPADGAVQEARLRRETEDYRERRERLDMYRKWVNRISAEEDSEPLKAILSLLLDTHRYCLETKRDMAALEGMVDDLGRRFDLLEDKVTAKERVV